MTNESTNPPMDCRTARDELPALIYDDLDGGLRERVERHLGTCKACRTELEAHRKTLRLLDTWSIDEGPPVSVGRQRGRRRMLAWLRPVLVGSAAAAVMFLALGALGGEVQYDRGRLMLSIGRTGDSRPAAVQDLSRFAERFSADVRGEVDGRFAALVNALDTDLAEMTRQQESRRVSLLRALDQQYFDDLQLQNQVLASLVRRFEMESMTNDRRFADISMVLSAPGAVRDRDEKY